STCQFDATACVGTLTPIIEVSRQSCVAPCGIFFDATGTEGLEAGEVVRATFSWDFDVEGLDPSAPQTNARGFFVAHVYHQPGTYEVSVLVRDVQGRAGLATTQIEVTQSLGPAL